MTRIGRAPDIRPGRHYRPEPPAPRQQVTYTCARGHEVTVTLAAGAELPPSWECRCGAAAHRAGVPAVPDSAAAEHERRMTQVRQRRTPAERDAILSDRLAELAAARKAGQP
jgi:hypothetical protein